MTNILRYLFRHEQRRRLPPHMVQPYRIQSATLQQRIVMAAGRAADPFEAQRLIDQLGFAAASRPKPIPAPDIPEKLRAVGVRLIGAQWINPYHRHYRAFERDKALFSPQIPLHLRQRGKGNTP
ncbi:MAG: hypothetical protein ACOYL5_16510 [Phototrophicaceae bacterium]